MHMHTVIILFILSLLFFFSWDRVVYFALAGGLFLDVFSPRLLGITPLFLLTIIGIYFLLNRYVSLKNIYSFAIFLIFANIIYNYFIYFLNAYVF